MNSIMNSYHALPILLGTFVFYTLTWSAVRFKKMKLSTHRRTWNNILLVGFLVAGLTGFLLTIQAERGQVGQFYRQALWLHVVFGLVMLEVSIIHIIWHFRYYTNSFFPRKNK